MFPNSPVLLPGINSNSPALGRPAAVMRDRRAILNRFHFNADRGQGAHGGLAAGTGTAHSNLHAPYPIFLGFVGRGQRSLLGGEGSSLARSAEAQRPGT